jgi:catechol 2,3-dioxygenase-like lactoylglutathione lyase family enzyme
MIKKIDHINIVVKDLEKAKKFFLNLGFTVQQEGMLVGEWLDRLTNLKHVKAEYIGLTLEGCETNLELLHFINPNNLTTWDNDILNKTGFRHVAFAVEDIKAVVNKLKETGVEFFSEIQRYEESNKMLCYFKGPEGIMLELAEYR